MAPHNPRYLLPKHATAAALLLGMKATVSASSSKVTPRPVRRGTVPRDGPNGNARTLVCDERVAPDATGRSRSQSSCRVVDGGATSYHSNVYESHAQVEIQVQAASTASESAGESAERDASGSTADGDDGGSSRDGSDYDDESGGSDAEGEDYDSQGEYSGRSGSSRGSSGSYSEGESDEDGEEAEEDDYDEIEEAISAPRVKTRSQQVKSASAPRSASKQEKHVEPACSASRGEEGARR